MTVCIDTNVVLGMFAARHPHRAIFDGWFAGRLCWAVTTEILFEYEEIMQLRASLPRAQAMLNILDLVHGRHGNVLHIHPTYRFHQITGDVDDDKFVDCAIAAEADYIITSLLV